MVVPTSLLCAADPVEEIGLEMDIYRGYLIKGKRKRWTAV